MTETTETRPTFETTTATAMAAAFNADALRQIAKGCRDRAGWMREHAHEVNWRNGFKACRPFVRDAGTFATIAAWVEALADAAEAAPADWTGVEAPANENGWTP